MRVALLERDDVLTGLRAKLEQATSGPGKVVLLSGEAGVGKSAVVAQLAAGAGDIEVLIGGCEPLFAARPLGALVDIATAIGGRLADVVARGERVHEVLPVLLDELRTTPTLLVLEDLQWADEATLDLAVLVGRRIASTRCLLVLTFRDDELARDHPLRQVLGTLAPAAGVERLQLAALTLAAVRVLAGDRADAAMLHARTGGNPFFLTEVLADDAPDVPASVRDAVLARAARLDRPAREVLDAVSIVAGGVSVGVLGELVGDHVGRVEECIASGMLAPRAGLLEFRHELARVAIEDSLDPVRATDLHARALTALGAEGADVARLAHHAEAAGDVDAVEHLAVAAAEAAERIGAHREAAAQYARVLRSCLLPPARRADLLQRCAHEHYLIDRFDQAVDQAKQAVEVRRTVGDPVALGLALRELASVELCAGGHEPAETSGREAVELLSATGPPEALAAACASLAAIVRDGGDRAGGLALARRALQLVAPGTAPDVVAHASTTLGVLEIIGGDDAGLERVESAFAVGAAAGLDEHVGRTYLCLLEAAQRTRRWDLDERYYGPAVEFCRERSLGLWERYLHIYHARTLLDRGRWAEATNAIPPDVDRSSSPLPLIVALIVVGLVRARRGDPGQWGPLEEAAALAAANGEPQWTAPAAAALAEAQWLAGRTAEIDVELLGDRLSRCVTSGDTWWAGQLAWWRRVAGVDEAPPCALPEPWRRQLAGRAGEAATAWADLGCPYDEALALAAGDEPDGWRRALDLLQRLEAAPAAAMVARRLRAAGERNLPRGARPSTRDNPAGLTARELDVTRLLIAGMRNAEIAARLVVSVKTVDHHVGAILTKLGAPNRAAAARQAQRLGIQDG